MQALEAAVNLYNNAPELHGEQLSKCYHSLVQLAMGREESVMVGGGEGQGWSYFNQILDHLDSKGKVSLCMCAVKGPQYS